jgi:very-short-patch-repair endonuclease
VGLVGERLPRPVCNLDVVEFGGWLARVDIAWPEWRVAVEYDGAVHLTEEARRKDARRRNLLLEHGWLVITATADDLRRPWVIAAQVRAALLSRGWTPAR